MSDNFDKKPSHTNSDQHHKEKRRLPVLILGIIGLFLLVIIVYMTTSSEPKPSDAAPDHPNPSAQPATQNNSSTASSS